MESPEPADQLLEETTGRYVLRLLVAGGPFLVCLSRLSGGPGEGADVGHQAARLRFVDLPAMGRHLRALAVEDTREQFRVGPPRLPGGVGEVGDLGKSVASLLTSAIRPMALFAMLMEQFANVARAIGRWR